ncbi:MAG: 4-alpha-glucanotransferase [Pyrinomonadaceae bacterium]
MMTFPRRSGVLLHPTSLPNSFGIGDLGKSAFEFVDFLGSAAQTYWQMLPLGPTGYGNSPYQSFSAFAGNTNLISPKILFDEGLLDGDDISRCPHFSAKEVEYGPVIEWKDSMLRKAYDRSLKLPDPSRDEKFRSFTLENAFWLEDYALFRAIKKTEDQKLWLDWELPLRNRDHSAIKQARRKLKAEIDAQKFYQFLFFDQWKKLKEYANGKGIKIIGDIPIFVSLDSADLWCSPEQFKLNNDLTPKVVAGVPPDYFSKTGQLWGNPIYDWERMRSGGFNWWLSRFRSNLELFDVVRIDHFRGFSAAWEVPGDDKTAENGEWVNVPGVELFQAIEREFDQLPVIAEDLGVMTPDVEDLRDSFGFPGMRILQYGFGGDPKSRDLPHNYLQNCVAYTGTHDNDTTIGWFSSLSDDSLAETGAMLSNEREFCLKYLNSSGMSLNFDMIRAIWASVANTAIVPLQDVLGLGREARMNVPATTDGNWSWRFEDGVLTGEIADDLRIITEVFGRSPD